MDLLVGFLIVMTVLVLGTLGSVAFLHWLLTRHNRVCPTVPTTAPVVWLWSPSTPARHHRRLRTAAATARTVPRWPDAPAHSRSALSVELEQQAVALDEWVVWTSRAPSRWRRDHYRSIQAQIRQLEGLVMRLSGLAESHPGVTADNSRRCLGEVAERLDQLEQAHAEVEAIERLTLGTSPFCPTERLSPAQPQPPEPVLRRTARTRF